MAGRHRDDTTAPGKGRRAFARQRPRHAPANKAQTLNLLRALLADPRYLRLSTAGKLALVVAVIQRADGLGQWYMSGETWARLAGVDRATVFRGIADAVAADKLLRREPYRRPSDGKGRQSGAQGASNYWLDPAIVAAAGNTTDSGVADCDALDVEVSQDATQSVVSQNATQSVVSHPATPERGLNVNHERDEQDQDADQGQGNGGQHSKAPGGRSRRAAAEAAAERDRAERARSDYRALLVRDAVLDALCPDGATDVRLRAALLAVGVAWEEAESRVLIVAAREGRRWVLTEAGAKWCQSPLRGQGRR